MALSWRGHGDGVESPDAFRCMTAHGTPMERAESSPLRAARAGVNPRCQGARVAQLTGAAFDDGYRGGKTTVMIRNLPRWVTRPDLVRELDDRGFQDAYHFVHVPVNITTKEGNGFAFVNFASPTEAARFSGQWRGVSWPGCGAEHGGRSMDVVASKVQGYAANTTRWFFRRSGHFQNHAFWPFMRYGITISL